MQASMIDFFYVRCDHIMKNIVLIVGARPNFMKAAPVYNALINKNKHLITIVHTGQHYDSNMSDIFLKQLGLDSTHITNLGIRNGTQNSQIANIMLSLEKLWSNKPNLVLVFGDVTSTLAASLCCNKLAIPVAHVESGNRSFDNTMPEEINRILVDRISDYHFVAEPNGLTNLKNELINSNNIHYVGNTMIDTLLNLKDAAINTNYYTTLGLEQNKYVLVTLHRPHNVDNNTNLTIILDALVKLCSNYKVVFPIHPRRKQLINNLIANKYNSPTNLIILDPQGYLEFMNLNIFSGVVVTDSGGIQEETTALNKPCITLRPNTEREITCTHGTNLLLKKLVVDDIVRCVELAINGKHPVVSKSINGWDGKAAERIADIICDNILL